MTVDCIQFFVPGLPAPQGSKRAFVRAGKPVLTEDCKRTRPWRTQVAAVALEHAPAAPWEGPVALCLDFILPRPGSIPHERRGYPAAKPDDDKLLRAVSDALTGVLYRDDAQRCETHVHKRYVSEVWPRPGVQIELTRMRCLHTGGRLRDGRCRDCGQEVLP